MRDLRLRRNRCGKWAGRCKAPFAPLRQLPAHPQSKALGARFADPRCREGSV